MVLFIFYKLKLKIHAFQELHLHARKLQKGHQGNGGFRLMIVSAWWEDGVGRTASLVYYISSGGWRVCSPLLY